MKLKTTGKHSFMFPNRPVITTWATVAGKKEAQGPIGTKFDLTSQDTYFGQTTWEQAENQMQAMALDILLEKSALKPEQIGLVASGDLLNQCIGSSFTLRNKGIPHIGLYGACSTMALSLIMGALTLESGAARRCICATSSHFCSSEKQFRLPLEYGGQRTPTAQWTVTGCGSENDAAFSDNETENLESTYEFDYGAKMTRELLDKHPECTAIIAVNDMMAMGCISVLNQRGIRVPEDMAICGFDNLYLDCLLFSL